MTKTKTVRKKNESDKFFYNYVYPNNFLISIIGSGIIN
jgi:hypothetical protein